MGTRLLDDSNLFLGISIEQGRLGSTVLSQRGYGSQLLLFDKYPCRVSSPGGENAPLVFGKSAVVAFLQAL